MHKKYIVFWKDGTTQEIEGDSIANAFNNAGILREGLPAIDYYEEIPAKKNINKIFDIDR